ncbi:MAG: hypothetical protein FWE68_04140 [Defluviitaleaceae bacterium]|nr:hypothetical protein [Defluviitaleaceae bacterium]
MGAFDIILIIFIVVVAAGAGLYFFNRWASNKMNTNQTLIDRSKQTASIYVIDKAKMRASKANLPKAVHEQLPRMYKIMKMPFVKAKIGPQVMTLMCDRDVYHALPLKKQIKVDLAGIYIVSMHGMKTKKEMKDQKKAKAAAKDGGGKPWDKVMAKFKRK